MKFATAESLYRYFAGFFFFVDLPVLSHLGIRVHTHICLPFSTRGQLS